MELRRPALNERFRLTAKLCETPVVKLCEIAQKFVPLASSGLAANWD
jgi:hypothetical protein